MATADVSAVHAGCSKQGTRLPNPWQSPSAAAALIAEAAGCWMRNNAMRMSAAVAMYSILSLGPLLVITIKVAAVFLREDAAGRLVERQVRDFLGPQGAAAVNDMVAHAVRPGAGTLAAAISAIILLVTASGVFVELRDSLNTIWGVAGKNRSGLKSMIRDRLLSFGMVFVIGFLLLVSQVVTTGLTAVGGYFLGDAGWVVMAIDLVVSTLVITLLFAALFRFLADARLGWRDVTFGAAVTAVLFKAGQFLLALYFTHASTASAYGAAGSFVVILLWVYYSCWILFFGAELVGAFARREGRRILSTSGSDRPATAAAQNEQHVPR